MASSFAKALIALFVLVLEVKVGWRARSEKHDDEVPPPAFLAERSVFVFLVSTCVEKFMSRLSAEDQKHVVAP